MRKLSDDVDCCNPSTPGFGERIHLILHSQAERDAWEWRGSQFTVREAYRSLLATEPPEDPVLVRRCRLVWRRHIPLKIKVFGWLLIRDRLMTCSLRQRFVLEADDGCAMCSGATEDCSHLFFECPLVQPVWNAAALGEIDVTAGDAFWQSICQGPFRRETEWQTIFATLWAIWLHRNEVIFRGACCEGDRKILAPRWHDPFGDSPPYVIEILVISSMTTGGHQFRVALYFFSK